MQSALILMPELGNNYGSLSGYVEGIAKQLSLSFYTRIISASDPNLISVIMDVGKSHDNLIFFGWFGFDIKISGLNIGPIYKLSSLLSCRQYGLIDDPVFASWIYNRIREADHRIRFLCTSTVLKSQILEIRGENSIVESINLPSPLVPIPLERLPSFNHRDIDILIPCTANYVDIEGLIERGRVLFGLGTLALMYFDEVKKRVNLDNYFLFDSYEFSRNFFFSVIPDLRAVHKHPLENGSILNYVWEVDAWIRHSFRLQIINYVATLNDLKIVLLSNSTDHSAENENLTIRPHAHGDDFISLLKRAKYVVDIAIPSATQIHIRAKAAFAAGAAVISNNPAMRELVDITELSNISRELFSDSSVWEKRRLLGHEYVNSLSFSSITDKLLC